MKKVPLDFPDKGTKIEVKETMPGYAVKGTKGKVNSLPNKSGGVEIKFANGSILIFGITAFHTLLKVTT